MRMITSVNLTSIAPSEKQTYNKITPIIEKLMTTPEARARLNIDSQLSACGWIVQDRLAMNLFAGRGVAVREFPLQTGYADYLLFVDRRAASETSWTKQLWIYDLRTNQNFTLKTRTLARPDLDDFVACYNPLNRHERAPTWTESDPQGRWRMFTYDELVARDKVNLDIFWLRDESLEDSANLPDPDVLAREIMEELKAALEQFSGIVEELGEEEEEG